MANEDVTDRLTSLEVIRRFRAHDYTLDDFVASRRERHPGREMMVFEGRSWSWQQVEETVQRMAFQLRADGVQAGLERVTDPVATNPDERLRDVATERGWRILELFPQEI